MQYAFVITNIDAFVTENAGELFRLTLIDYRERNICLLGGVDQQINIQAVKSQVLPMVMLADQIELQADDNVTIPATALVSVVPIAASAIKGVLDAGKAEEILKSLSLKAC